MTLVTYLLFVATCCLALARWARLPSIPVLIAGGFLLSRVSEAVVPASGALATLYELSVTFLVFSIGTELQVIGLRRYWGAALLVVAAEFVMLGLLGTLTSLQRGLLPALYVGLAVAASSTLVGISILQRRAQLFEPFGRVVVLALVMQDLIVIWLVAALEGASGGVTGALVGLLQALLLTVLAFFVARLVVPRLMVPLQDDEETLLLSVLALLFLFVGGAYAFGLPPFVGGFLAGMALSAFPVRGLVRGLLYSLTDFFQAIFFVTLGAMLSIPSLPLLGEALGLTAAIIGLTPLVVLLAGERAGLTARSALETGMLLSQTSEMSVVVIIHAVAAGVLSPDDSTVFVLVTALTMSCTEWLSRDRVIWKLLRLHPARAPLPESLQREHVLVLGAGDTGRQLAREMVGSGQEVVVVDDDPAIVASLQGEGFCALRGDGSDYRVLEAAGLGHAQLVISTLRRPKDQLAALKRRPNVTAVMRVFAAEEARELERKGAIPVLYSHAAVPQLLEWIDSQPPHTAMTEEKCPNA